MSFKRKFYVSLTANILVAASAIYVYIAQPDRAPNPAQSLVQPAPTITLQQTTKTPKDYSQLINAGLNDRQAKAVIVQQLVEQYVESIPLPENRYWEQNPHRSSISYMLPLIDAYDQVRQALYNQFGNAASSDPAFEFAFKPLALQSPYLSSEEQVVLQRFQAEQQLKLFAGAPEDPTSEIADPSTLLSVSSWNEYRLRSSFLADQLRHSGVSFTEATFRDTYALLNEGLNQGMSGDMGMTNDKRQKLTDLLGQDAMLKLWSQLDPTFAARLSAGQQSGLSDNDILAAQDIIDDANQAIADAHQQRQIDPETGLEQMMSAINERREQLVALIGDDATDALLQAQPQQPQNPLFPIHSGQ